MTEPAISSSVVSEKPLEVETLETDDEVTETVEDATIGLVVATEVEVVLEDRLVDDAEPIWPMVTCA